jgi:hypothetical protein
VGRNGARPRRGVRGGGAGGAEGAASSRSSAGRGPDREHGRSSDSWGGDGPGAVSYEPARYAVVCAACDLAVDWGFRQGCWVAVGAAP